MIDRRHVDRAGMQTRWREYLQIAWTTTTEPIGQHYLRRILAIFKFELNVLVASVLTMPGIVVLATPILLFIAPPAGLDEFQFLR